MALSKPIESGLPNFHPFSILQDILNRWMIIPYLFNYSKGSFTSLLVYVDDITLLENDKEEIVPSKP